MFWTHNDSGGDPAVFAVDSTGALLARVRLPGVSNRDWEDIGIGPCEPGGGPCLFLGDIGDNSERHERIAVYRIPEPDPATDSVSGPVAILLATYPDGPRDAEGLFVTEAGIHIVNKGRSDAIDLFRLPPPYDTSTTVSLERVQRLAPPPTSVSAQVTAAAVDPTGQRAAIRTYSSIRFFAVEADTLRPLDGQAGMVAPSQLQGEGLDFISPDLVILTSEAQASRPASLVILSCDPLRAPPDTLSDSGG
ncbi:MAG: hypothetical protein GWM90_03765 [Gemmatimonadetes bacterium]|nr:hypothetical protein [Gemmatimonadota bacterium]NIQ52776.1 hypothetical protein [Gemmatimonadota bacterium]NIU72906.1 hypothetical protein [Gammaproteobacteria bacterium]NIX43266.1 hypothetical protein [Gemmatimonadota bacterium]NIY07443.1 hypothetical protein [Gemmatimonadota bacterium]